MHSHPNDRVTQKSRLRLVNEHLQNGRHLAELAAKQASVFAEPTSGWPATAQVVLLLWPGLIRSQAELSA